MTAERATDKTTGNSNRPAPDWRRRRCSTAVLDNLSFCKRASRLSPPRTTSTWRSPTRCATGCCALDQHRADLHRARREARLLPVGRVPARAAARQQPDQPRHRSGRARGDGGARPGSRRAARAGGGAGPRQRRPRPAGGVLHGFAGHAGDPGDRLRHPLRVRHLRSGDPRRLAGRGHRQVAAARQPLGDRAAGDRASTSASAAAPSATRRRRPLPGALGAGDAWSRASPTTRRSSATGSTPATRCACGRRRRSSRSTSRHFNVGDYYGAVEEKMASENAHQGALPERRAGRSASSLRLEQQYFFVSCSLQDMLRMLACQGCTDRALPREVRGAAERHPPGDRGGRADAAAGRRARHATWDEAWEITRAHARLHQPHAAARGARDLAAGRCSRDLLPRHLEIIYEINRRFLDEVRHALSGRRRAPGAHVAHRRDRRDAACAWPTWPRVGSHAVNGVAALHSELLKHDRAARLLTSCGRSSFTNVTNGVTPRRFLALCNPGLARLITRRIGDGWITDLDAAAGARAARRRRGLPRRSGARSSARTRTASAQRIARAHRRRRRSRLRCSTSRSSASTSTSAST